MAEMPEPRNEDDDDESGCDEDEFDNGPEVAWREAFGHKQLGGTLSGESARVPLFAHGPTDTGKTYTKIHATPKKEKTMAKTIYSTHVAGNTATGAMKEIPIFMLDNSHLENIIRQKVDNFCKNRTRFSEVPTYQDPMVAAMGKTLEWNAEKLQTVTTQLLEDLQAYVAEAVVRGGSALTQAQESMRALTKRDAAVAPAAAQINLDEPEEEF